MFRNQASAARGARRYQGSALLASSISRVTRVALAVAGLWLLTAWALGWLS
ncbi:hypothetical protein [Allopusillimonas soli]|uniref:Uncharacterized protein n=1 Tax=Allopusillimonas soli TaxID=659016 RepID=A0A853FBD3_9BURK|nr:hypothetical protein [Allopusillimonas soli]NYT38075.1 hypothetical protein [Allopusillimonas soli]